MSQDVSKRRSADTTEEFDVILDATLECIARTRRTLVMIITLASLGAFHLYQWYASWELARVDARLAAAQALEQHATHYRHSTRLSDHAIVDQWRIEANVMKKNHYDSSVPLLGLGLPAPDLPPVLGFAGVATMLWLIFNQLHLNQCLHRLEKVVGWGMPKAIVENYFGLIGKNANPVTRAIGRMLPLTLPALSLAFLASDVYDVLQIYLDPIQGLAFEGDDYRARIGVRFLLELGLGTVLVTLGLWSYKEWCKTENELLKFSASEDFVE